MLKTSLPQKKHLHPIWVGAAVIAILGALITAFVLLFAHSTCCTENLNEKQIVEISNDAKKGNIASMKRLFFFFEERSMNGDSEKSAYWLKRAADSGDDQAGVFMYEKLNTSKDPEMQRQAMTYLRGAADRGDPIAQEILKNLHPGAPSAPK